MRRKRVKHILTTLALLAVFLAPIVVPVSQAQAPSAVSLYSVWVRLSLRGYNQQEIESLMRNMDRETILDVKNRLRQTVITNLELKKTLENVQASRDSDDLNQVLSSIATEIRFAGLQSDSRLKVMIKDRFGIQITRY